jgi:hypothetical protein
MESSPAARSASTKRIIWMLWALLVLANGFVFATGLAGYAWISSKNVAAVAEDKALYDTVQISLIGVRPWQAFQD